MIGKELGVTVHPYDDGSRDGMVDGRYTHGDGRQGVVEVTTYGDPEAFRTESIIAKIFPEKWVEPSLEWAWIVTIPIGVNPHEVKQRLLPTLQRCEREGIAAYYRLNWPPQWLTWFDERNIHLTGISTTNRSGAIDVMPDLSDGGAVPDTVEPLDAWIDAALLSDPVVVRHIDKLLVVPDVERHLYVRVDSSIMPFGALDLLAMRNDLTPSMPPAVPDGLTGLWFGTRWGLPLTWTRTTGWRRVSLS